MVDVLNPCLDCTPFPGGNVLSCELLDDFTNRSGLPGDGWGNASYVFANGQHLAWTVSDVALTWVDSNLGILDMPTSSSSTVSATAQAPAAYGFTGNFIAGSGYTYTVGFWAAPVFNSSTDPFPANAKFRIQDANGSVTINLQTGVVTATRAGGTPGTYTSGALSFLTKHTYDVELVINPTTTGIIIRNGATDINGDPQTPTVVLSASTSAATTPTATQSVDPQVAIIGGGGDPFRARVSRVELAPCERPLALSPFWSGYEGRQTREASAMGGPASIIIGPAYASTGLLKGVYHGAIGTSGEDQGNREEEWRSWLSWLVPPGTQYVRLVGTERALEVGLISGTGLSVGVSYQLGPVAFNPDTGPVSFDNTGSGLNGSVTEHDDPETIVPLDVTSATLGASYNAGDGIAWHLFQLAIRNVSPQGIGLHYYGAKPGHADGAFDEILDRFPNNPDWQRAPNPIVSYSYVQSGVMVDVEAWAFGINGGSPVVAAPRSGQPVLNEFVAIGDGVTTAFSVMRAYAPLSLDIDIDGMHLGGVGETNPSTGAFGLTFAPAIGERITANYQGAAA